ncbi:hypothetical protein HIM_05190 [Hirsutella minnesotensis 3608]|uniref:FAD/NAD(P)-binding domain-containing protein n=1 Tax=Hirsutella minnesotensis 3608 TaxID=1043627 RepID=A0A0F8A5K6_9HYPO|nr:hypothetical protein HIM_05190 [Hirsutella minnesotensis 3608]
MLSSVVIHRTTFICYVTIENSTMKPFAFGLLAAVVACADALSPPRDYGGNSYSGGGHEPGYKEHEHHGYEHEVERPYGHHGYDHEERPYGHHGYDHEERPYGHHGYDHEERPYEHHGYDHEERPYEHHGYDHEERPYEHHGYDHEERPYEHHGYEHKHKRPYDFDVVVVGGGPAGLSATSSLARVRRKVLMIDSAEYRNNPTLHAHDILGFDGVTPAFFRTEARKQVMRYPTVTMTNGTVTKIEPQDGNKYFKVTYGKNNQGQYGSGGGKTVTARRIILGTGLRDNLPSTPGVAKNWGRGIYWCTWCDGFEHADQKMGLLANIASVPGMVRTILTLNHDIVALTNGTSTPQNQQALTEKEPGWQAFLARNNVTIDDRPLKEIKLLEGVKPNPPKPNSPTEAANRLFLVEFTHGPPIKRNGFLLTANAVPAPLVRSEPRIKLTDKHRIVVNGEHGFETTMPGVFSAGDPNDGGAANVYYALWSAKRAAVNVHSDLAKDDAKAQEGLSKRAVETNAEALWEMMNEAPGHVLYGGKFNKF